MILIQFLKPLNNHEEFLKKKYPKNIRFHPVIHQFNKDVTTTIITIIILLILLIRLIILIIIIIYTFL